MLGSVKLKVSKLDNWGFEAADGASQRETQIHDEGRDFVNIPDSPAKSATFYGSLAWDGGFLVRWWQRLATSFDWPTSASGVRMITIVW